MIAGISLQNFKGFTKCSLELGSVNLFVGQNGTGKSTPIQALMLLKQSRGQSQLIADGAFFPGGSFEELFHAHDVSKPLGFGVAGRFKIAPAPGLGFDGNGRFNHDLEFVNQVLSRQRITLGLTGGGQVTLDWRAGQPATNQMLQIGPVQFNFQPNSVIGYPVGGGGYTPADRFSEESGRLSSGLYSAINTTLDRVYYVPATRGVDRSRYALQDNWNAALASLRGTEAPASLMVSTLAYRRDIEDKVSQSMSNILERRVQASLVPNREVAIKAQGSNYVTNVTNDGSGFNNLLMPLAQVYLAGPGALVGIEEPEAGLHPRAQASLVRELVSIALKEKTQLILTTHSEHVVLALLTLIREGKLPPTEIKVHEFSRGRSECTAAGLRVGTDGRLEKGLSEFFEADLDQLERYLSVNRVPDAGDVPPR